MKKHILSLAVTVLFVMTAGASCPRTFKAAAPPAPTVFLGAPTIGQIIDVVNANTSRIQQLQTSSARLLIEGAPRLQATLALERPRRFRLRAETSLTGSELDMGSNDEVFWMWAKRNEPEGVYYARHDEFRPGAMAGTLPLPPSWLIEALGLVTLDANTAYDGPHARIPGQVELSYVTNDATPLMKTLVVDDQRGHILEQRVYDSTGTLIASARMSDYRFDATAAVSLPHTISVQLPATQLAFTFKIDGYQVNALYSDPMSLWSMPQMDAPYLNLAGS